MRLRKPFDAADLMVAALVGFLWHASRYSDWWMVGAFMMAWILNILIIQKER